MTDSEEGCACLFQPSSRRSVCPRSEKGGLARVVPYQPFTSLVTNCHPPSLHQSNHHLSRKPLLLPAVALVSTSTSLSGLQSICRFTTTADRLSTIAPAPQRRHSSSSAIVCPRNRCSLFGHYLRVRPSFTVAAVGVKLVVVANSSLHTAHLLITRPIITCDTAYVHNQTQCLVLVETKAWMAPTRSSKEYRLRGVMPKL